MRFSLSAGALALLLAACAQPSDPLNANDIHVGVVVGPEAAPPLNALNFVAHPVGDQEVPPHDTPAQGEAVFHLSADGVTMHYRLLVANISNVVASHIHIGPAGVNGPIVVFLFGNVPPGGGRVDGVLAEGSFTA